MKFNGRYFFKLFIVCFALIQTRIAHAQNKTIDQRVDSVLQLMTPEEKVGQMNQYSSTEELTGPKMASSDLLQEIKQGRLGSVLNIRGAKQTRQLQEAAMQTR